MPPPSASSIPSKKTSSTAPPPGLGYAAVVTSARSAVTIAPVLPLAPPSVGKGPAVAAAPSEATAQSAAVPSPLENLWGAVASASPEHNANGASPEYLGNAYPPRTEMIVTVRPSASDGDEIEVRGTVFVTDEQSGMIVLQGPAGGSAAGEGAVENSRERSVHMFHFSHVVKKSVVGGSDGAGAAPPPIERLPTKQLEDRERSSIRQAMKILSHINLEASGRAQSLFDRLVRACNDVSWSSDGNGTIVVLDQVKIVSPYTPEDCSLCAGLGGRSVAMAQESLARVRRIVGTFQEK
mmetsp:Transcript_34539/g.67967  ORF Transcript_34539/g.67967 Transcript_34539/m.67967 type:complete len:295 (-) Transcript_34539:98-982(-)